MLEHTGVIVGLVSAPLLQLIYRNCVWFNLNSHCHNPVVFVCNNFHLRNGTFATCLELSQTALPNGAFGAGCSSLTTTAPHIAVLLPNPDARYTKH